MIALAQDRQFLYSQLMNLSTQPVLPPSPPLVYWPCSVLLFRTMLNPIPEHSFITSDSLDTGWLTSTEKSCSTDVQNILFQRRKLSTRLQSKIITSKMEEGFHQGISAPAASLDIPSFSSIKLLAVKQSELYQVHKGQGLGPFRSNICALPSYAGPYYIFSHYCAKIP